MQAIIVANQHAAPRIDVEGETWRLLGTGRASEGVVLCHLASTTQFREQRNGRVPVQIQVDVDADRVEAAVHRPRGFFGWNPALRGAFLRGEQAALDGESADACPYRDKRQHSGKLTWSRSFQSAWADGFEWGRAAQETPASDSRP